MLPEIISKLGRLNREFYDQQARPFAESRASLPDGILRSLQWLHGAESFLDVGCGDGRIGRALFRERVPNDVKRYLGVDFSRELLQQPTEEDGSLPNGFELRWCDLISRDWAESSREDSEFVAAVCLAVLFHIPGAEPRRQVVDGVFRRLAPSARAVFSVWQFLHVPRMRRKVVDWSEVDVEESDLDPGDLLLDWQRGGRGLRYVHHFEEDEVVQLLESGGFAIEETFRSDGATGDMSLFLKVRKPDVTGS